MKNIVEIGDTYAIYTPSMLANVVQSVVLEMARGEKKHPARTWSPHEGYGIIQEEVDEFFDAIKANDLAHAKIEALQVAAVAIAFILKADWRV